MVYNAKEKVFAVGERDGQIAMFYDMSDIRILAALGLGGAKKN